MSGNMSFTSQLSAYSKVPLHRSQRIDASSEYARRPPPPVAVGCEERLYTTSVEESKKARETGQNNYSYRSLARPAAIAVVATGEVMGDRFCGETIRRGDEGACLAALAASIESALHTKEMDPNESRAHPLDRQMEPMSESFHYLMLALACRDTRSAAIRVAKEIMEDSNSTNIKTDELDVMLMKKII